MGYGRFPRAGGPWLYDFELGFDRNTPGTRSFERIAFAGSNSEGCAVPATSLSTRRNTGHPGPKCAASGWIDGGGGRHPQGGGKRHHPGSSGDRGLPVQFWGVGALAQPDLSLSQHLPRPRPGGARWRLRRAWGGHLSVDPQRRDRGLEFGTVPSAPVEDADHSLDARSSDSRRSAHYDRAPGSSRL